MNYLNVDNLKAANIQVIYNLYLYLAHKAFPTENESFKSVVYRLNSSGLSDVDRQKLKIIKAAINGNSTISYSKISNFTYSKRGLTACVFTAPDGNISVVFKGTGKGEWIDNGEGLSGIPEENTYISYLNGKEIYKTVKNDYATDQQTEALNWFLKTAYENGWDENFKITVSGHSKGANKAQFITIHSDLINHCYSFDGQGFSPEALASLKNLYGEKYEIRRKKIFSLSADNDYVNVLGKRLMPQNQVYYFESEPIFHPIEAMLNNVGVLNAHCTQGRLSEYVESMSDELMDLKPEIRRYVTRAVMNIFQKYLGDKPLNGDFVSLEETIAGITIAVSYLLNKF
ncbi:MAG: DUF2974 domain-containing protein [Clostridia bacterium]|nr:DUF2974 domain-containing protein [Clostridia bacterium]